MEDDIKIVWAEFSSLSWAVFIKQCNCMAYSSTFISRVDNSAPVLALPPRTDPFRGGGKTQIQQISMVAGYVSTLASTSRYLLGLSA